MELIDEQDDLAVRLLDLLEHGLQAVFKLAAVLGASHQRAHVQLDKVAVTQRAGHVAGHNTLGDALDDGGLAHARLANQYRIVLGTTRKNLNGAANLVGTANYRVELAGARKVADVAAVLLQRLELSLVLGRGNTIIAAQLLVDLLDALARDTCIVEDAACISLILGERHEQVLGHHKGVAHLGGLFLGLIEHADHVVGKPDLRAVARDLGGAIDCLLRSRREHGGVGANALDDHGDVALASTQQRRKQVHGFDRARLSVGCDANGRLESLARSHCQLIDSHISHLSYRCCPQRGRCSRRGDRPTGRCPVVREVLLPNVPQVIHKSKSLYIRFYESGDAGTAQNVIWRKARL